MAAESSGNPVRTTPASVAPRLRVTFVFEYRPFTYADENLTPDELAARDEEAFNCGDLTWEDVEGYEVIENKVEAVPND